MLDRTIRASEIAQFTFCQRAWWYGRQGQPSENQPSWEAGTEWHKEHGRAVVRAGCLRTLGYVFLIAATVTLAISLTVRFVG